MSPADIKRLERVIILSADNALYYMWPIYLCESDYRLYSK